MNYIVEGEILTSLANAIREKTSSTEKLVFPDEFETGIKSLEDLLILPELDMNYPLDLTVNLVDGEINATFSSSIKTQGVPSKYTYTWYLDGQVVPEATGAVFTKIGAIEAGEHTVYYEITNDAGTVTSRVAKLTVYSVPVLDANYPQDTETILENGVINASFSAVISIPGTPAEYSYQWYLDGEPLEGATSAVLTKKDYVEAGNHNVYCEVTNEAGTVTSRIAKLTIYSLPELDANYPQDVTVILKDGKINATFNAVIATPGVPAEYTYQWYLDGNLVQGVSGAAFTKNDSISTGEHNIYCEITNKAGTISTRVAKLTVQSLPILNSTYPTNVDVSYLSGETANATFKVIIAEDGAPASYTYQWYINDEAISGATKTVYNWSGTEGTYNIYCKVTNAAGTVKSRVATLNVTKYYTPVLNTSYPTNASKTYISGGTASATFEVKIATAGVPASYTYQWYVNNSAVSGATGSSYTWSGTEGNYNVYCKVTNSAGTVTSRTATLSVTKYYTPVLNSSYPANASKTYISGGTASASFSVSISTAGVPASYTYQWYLNNSAVSGATSATYNWSGTEGTYTVYCKVTNAAGTVTSRTATLSVTRYYKPTLNSSYPANASKTYISGSTASASFSVSVSTAGVPASYTYQWYLNNSAVSGATSATYNWSGTEGTYSIYCKVTNAAGTVTSRTATLSVTRYYTPTLNSSYPANASKTYISGGTASASFSVDISTAGVPASYTYQWYLNNSAVSGATGSTYNWSGTEGTYYIYCKVSNAAGTVTSRTATLSVTRYYTPVLNSSYPQNVTFVENANGSATFNVFIATAGNPTSYTYQWYVNNSAVSGATGSSYTKSGLTSATTYSVYCKVTNAAGTVISRTATLTVESSKPIYTYSGNASFIQDSTYNWRIKFLTSGVLNFSHLGNAATIDVFCVGGGGGGSNASDGYGIAGAGGGYTKTSAKISIKKNTDYTITVGAGGNRNSSGGTSSAFNVSADGGKPPSGRIGGAGGSGGGAGCAGSGGSNGSDGGASPFDWAHTDYCKPGTGQQTTTREFGDSNATLYSGGGGGGWDTYRVGSGGSGGGGGGANVDNRTQGGNGQTNTGGGGGGASYEIAGGTGGSGIVVIRNAR